MLSSSWENAFWLFFREKYGDDVAAEYVAKRRTMTAATRAAGSQRRGAGSQRTDNAGQAAVQPPESSKWPVLPYGFWVHFIKEELKLRNSPAKRIQCVRALCVYIERSAAGSSTRAGLRDGRKGNTCRNSNAGNNRCLALGLGFMLLQFFVDFVQNLFSRGDSIILMSQARVMADDLVNSGTLAPSELPKLEGDAGKHWFLRWRRKYGIVWRKLA